MSTDARGTAERAKALLRQTMIDLVAGRTSAGLERLEECLALDSAFAPAWSTRAGVRLREGRFNEALHDIERAMSLRPGHVGDLHNRAVIWTALQMHERAISDYEIVLGKSPGSAGTLNNLAWLLATARDARVRDGTRAVACARAAVRAKRAPAWLDTLAAAYAECGNFGAAVATEEEAIRRSDSPVESFARRLALYRRGQTVAEDRPEPATGAGARHGRSGTDRTAPLRFRIHRSRRP